MAPANATVKEGDPVVRFDASGAQRQLKEKEAALAQAVASVEQAKADAEIVAEQDKLEIASLKQAVELARIEVSKAQILSAIQADDNKIALGMAEEKLRVKEAASAFNLHRQSRRLRLPRASGRKPKPRSTSFVIGFRGPSCARPEAASSRT
jgi:multidrug efflux pump subunit AcrA (membrane-fusion protein)